MPFELSEMNARDCDEFAEVDAAAMEGSPIGQAMDIDARSREGRPRKEMIRSWMVEALKKRDPKSMWIKVTDTKSGAMVAAAAWTWQSQREMKSISKAEAGDASEGAEVVSPEENPSIYAAMTREWSAIKNEFFPAQSYYNLQVCITHPSWERRGAGSMLVKHGCDLADEAGVICVLMASPEGYGLYLKHGFQVVKDSDLDLRPYGVEGTVRRRAMIRLPKTSHSAPVDTRIDIGCAGALSGA